MRARVHDLTSLFFFFFFLHTDRVLICPHLNLYSHHKISDIISCNFGTFLTIWGHLRSSIVICFYANFLIFITFTYYFIILFNYYLLNNTIIMLNNTIITLMSRIKDR